MLSKNQIKFVRSLELKKNRKREHLFVAEGPKVVGDLLKAGFRPHSIFSTDPRQDGQLVTEEELQRISFLQHPQEVLAVFEIPDSEHRPINPNGLSLALD
jgi:TrmH family RNA methyltransferase